MRTLKMLFFITALTSLFACGKVNNETPFVDHSNINKVEWTRTHKTVAPTAAAVCAGCHGADLSGGISKTSCMNPTARCHTSSPVAAPNGCSSCHAAGTTGPNGDTAPNRANAHAKHLALNGVSCATCHAGAGYDTVLHADGKADVLLATAFNAKAGTFSYNAGSCSAVSCHGGQATPSWSAGSIIVATDCLKCHEQGTASQTPQFNSFYSGNKSFNGGITRLNLHELHLKLDDTTTSSPIVCTSCHNIGNHFSDLATPEFGRPAIGGGNTRIAAGKYIPYDINILPSGSCDTSCHSFNTPLKNWINP